MHIWCRGGERLPQESGLGEEEAQRPAIITGLPTMYSRMLPFTFPADVSDGLSEATIAPA